MALSVTTGTGTANGGSSSITITKPTSLAAGDLMIAKIVHMSASAVTGSGWTAVTNQPDSPFFDSTNGNLTVLAKVATSGDAAASNFTFTSSNEAIGIIYRVIRTLGPSSWPAIASVLANLVVYDSDVVTASGSVATFTGGVTPVGADSLLILTVAHSDGGATFSTYDIVTSDPTWTEAADIEGDTVTSQTLGLASAYGVRSAATATGNYAATASAGNPDCIGCLVSITEQLNVSPSPAVIDLALSIQAPSVSGGANVSIANPIDLTASVQAPTVSTAAAKWVNKDKTDTNPTISNVDKS